MATTPTPVSSLWPLWAILAMLSFSANNFLLGAVGKETGRRSLEAISAIITLWIVAGLCGAGAWIFFSFVGSRPKFGGWQNFLLVVLVGLLIASSTLILSLAFTRDPDSTGPIAAMLPLNGLMVCALAWQVLGETLGTQHVIGICIAVAGPICMALADTSDAALEGLLLGGCSAVIFSTSNFMRKWLGVRRGVNSISVLVGLMVTLGVVAAVVSAVLVLSGEGAPNLNPPRLWGFAALSGLFWVVGSVFFQAGLMGFAGPSTAIANTNSVGVLILQLVFFQPQVRPMKVLGMGLCITGCMVLSLAPPPPRPVQNLELEEALKSLITPITPIMSPHKTPPLQERFLKP
mmetsp:Transcript_61300/g.145964  ORF Transcript_61300/g.145964 Transcript_61300/m.145964 type:complete len:347 (-) Transcript_61300:76-1116(-)